jgi:hypothetical protein
MNSHASPINDPPPNYEAKAVVLLGLGFGHTLTVGLFGLTGGLILSFFIKETAPRFVGQE